MVIFHVYGTVYQRVGQASVFQRHICPSAPADAIQGLMKTTGQGPKAAKE